MKTCYYLHLLRNWINHHCLSSCRNIFEFTLGHKEMLHKASEYVWLWQMRIWTRWIYFRINCYPIWISSTHVYHQPTLLSFSDFNDPAEFPINYSTRRQLRFRYPFTDIRYNDILPSIFRNCWITNETYILSWSKTSGKSVKVLCGRLWHPAVTERTNVIGVFIGQIDCLSIFRHSKDRSERLTDSFDLKLIQIQLK